MHTLSELFHDLLKDVYYAENALLKALPKMEKAATSKDLKKAFSDHLEETKGQVQRLEQVFGILNLKPEGKECHAIKGLIAESEDLIGENPDPCVLDAGLVGDAQAVEHYEMSRYGTLRAWADCLGLADAARLLEQTLAQEKAADAMLSVLAVSTINDACESGLESMDEDSERASPGKTSSKPPAGKRENDKNQRGSFAAK